MQNEIAVILDKNHNLAKLQEANTLLIYKRQDMLWKVHNEININNMCNGTIPVVRENLSKLIKSLRDCRIIVGNNITGIVYHVFNQEGFIISELNSFQESMLESIYHEISNEMLEMKEEMESSKKSPTRPYETNRKNHYFFDFNLLKNSNASYTSKSTIIPFLNSTTFEQLEIICDHIMPWFHRKEI